MGWEGGEGRWGVNVQVNTDAVGSASLRNGLFEFGVKYANAACLDEQIGTGGSLFERGLPGVRSGRINDYSRPIRIGNVTMLLTLICVGLVERYIVTQHRKLFEQAVIIGGSAVPI